MDIGAMFTNITTWIQANLLIFLGACVAGWFFLFKGKKRRRGRSRARGRSVSRGRGYKLRNRFSRRY